MHLAHVIHRYPPARGGAESYFHRLTAAHRNRGDDVTVLTTTALELRDFRSKHTYTFDDPPHVHRFRPISFPLRRYVLKALSLIPHRPWQLAAMPSSPTCPAMWRAVQHHAAPLDAVHATALPYGFPLLCAWALAKRRRVPLLLTPFLHFGDLGDVQDRTRRQYTRPELVWLMKRADHLFVQTEAERDVLVKLGLSDTRMTLQGLGVEPGECTGGDRAAARARWGVMNNTFVVGHLANLSVEKGSLDLLSALEGVPNITAVLAGPQMPNFRAAATATPVLLGELTDVQKRDFYAGIDAFCLPSMTDSYGLVLLEAWANAKPVVVYRAGGPGELVRHGVDGLIAPAHDFVTLRMQLQLLADDRAMASQLGEAGRQRVLEEHIWSDKLNIVFDVLNGLTR